MGEWSVVIEVVGETDQPPISPERVEEFEQLLVGHGPVVSYGPYGYEVTIGVQAPDAFAAATEAAGVWREARRDADLPPWPATRIEVLSAAELD